MHKSNKSEEDKALNSFGLKLRLSVPDGRLGEDVRQGKYNHLIHFNHKIQGISIINLLIFHS